MDLLTAMKGMKSDEQTMFAVAKALLKVPSIGPAMGIGLVKMQEEIAKQLADPATPADVKPHLVMFRYALNEVCVYSLIQQKMAIVSLERSVEEMKKEAFGRKLMDE